MNAGAARVLFLAPLKAPDHPVPSGDRTVARLYLAALQRAGFAPEPAGTLRTFLREGGDEAFAAMAEEARREVAAVLGRERGRPAPALVFTYHSYHRAPDLVGPALAAALGRPHVIAEAIIAPRQAQGPFAAGHRASRAAILRADLLIVSKPRDRTVLERERGAAPLLDLPPFLDSAGLPLPEPRPAGGPGRLLTVAMMRGGDKLASYRALAEALPFVPGEWRLEIAGDGEARAEVETLFAPFGHRVAFLGRLSGEALHAAYLAADLLLWPGVNEAYGMVFLEAAALGLPAVAADHGGIRAVLRHGATGLITPAGDPRAFAAAVAQLLASPGERAALAAGALRFARGERSLEDAAAILRRALAPLAARCGTTP